jgi:hypothetical protein
VSLQTGAILGSYEVLSSLGAGGMGEVYRARDTRIGREVALKVLPASFAKDQDRLARFEREARAAGALSHPNVVTLHDVGHIADGTPFLVTEMLEGATLRTTLAARALPPRKAVDYAIQIARGLGAAHELGILHRDLKPENLFVTQDGRVKILDFGLAKLTRPQEGAVGPEADTLTSPTSVGIVLGTAGYMSPEQVQGLPADARSDIFSFGAVLYEMLSGRRAFKGATTVETMNAILKEDPPEISAVSRPLSPALERILRGCLEKKAEERFHSAHDLALALEAVAGGSSVEAPEAAAPIRRGRRLVLTCALLLGANIAAWLFFGKSGGSPPTPSFHRLTFRQGAVLSARFARDGQTVVYSASWAGDPGWLFSTGLGSPESRLFDLPEADIAAVSAAGEMALKLWPQGRVWTRTATTLALVPMSGGAPRPLLEGVTGADWSPDGKELAVIRRVGDHQRLEFPVGKVRLEGADISGPRISPRGDLVAFIDDDSAISVVDRNGTKRSLTKKGMPFQFAWSPGGDEVWFTDVRERFESAMLRAVRLSGEERLLPLVRVPAHVDLYDVSREGRVLLGLGSYQKNVFWHRSDAAPEQDLTWLDASRAMDVSADGRRLLFHESGQGGGKTGAVYIRDLEGSAPPVRLGEGFAIVLSPDGKWALTQRQGSPGLFLLPTGAGEPRAIGGAIEYWNDVGSFFPDGRRVLVQGGEKGRPERSFVVDIETGDARPVTPEGVVATAVLPDGQRVAALDGERRILLHPVDGGEPTVAPGPPEPGELGRFIIEHRWFYATEFDGRKTRVFRRDIASGRRELWKTITPADPAGLRDVEVIPIGDGRSYVYTCHRTVSSLYVLEGLK